MKKKLMYIHIHTVQSMIVCLLILSKLDHQKMLYECMSKTGKSSLDMDTAWEIRELYKSTNELTQGMIEQILNGSSALSVKLNRKSRIALDQDVFDKYFRNVPKKEVVGIVEKALEMYFKSVSA